VRRPSASAASITGNCDLASLPLTCAATLWVSRRPSSRSPRVNDLESPHPRSPPETLPVEGEDERLAGAAHERAVVEPRVGGAPETRRPAAARVVAVVRRDDEPEIAGILALRVRHRCRSSPAFGAIHRAVEHGPAESSQPEPVWTAPRLKAGGKRRTSDRHGKDR
jgi:hypothetical protein